MEDNDGDAEDNDGDMGPGERVLLVALPHAGLCRAAVDVAREHGFTVLVTVLASLAPGPAWARGDLSLRLTAAVAA